VFDAATDSATVIVHNRGTTPVAWQFGLVRMGRTSSGRLRPRAGTDSAATIVEMAVEVTPRECVLAAGESRTIHLLVRRPLRLPSGEYRSHLFVREKSPLAAEGDETGFSVGAAVPIVLRSGPASVRWRDEQFRPGCTRGAPAIVILDLEPRGSSSAI
jgi:hypothetical protein